MRKITVVKGDEYRAKIERDFSKDDFFAEVYNRANDIINEIVQEMKKYREENEERNSYAIRYQGMGNNILLFCAERGQGKTSAMQSVAQALRVGKDFALLKKQDKETDEKSKFYVLDSIDPTALESKESILRVFLARLFSQYDKIVNAEKNIGLDDRRFRLEHEALLGLFQQCFVNLDYLKGEAKRDAGLDDLEYLAQMGNGAVLKENLFKLVDSFFSILHLLDKDGAYKEINYLVVQIDDTDLSAGNIFAICEDIRNYLSVPNIIIMMAVDYDNLTEAVYKKFLEENKIFWCGTGDSHQKVGCVKKAAKYMEKVFPSGHRINLPLIDDALSQGEKKIKVSYIDDEKRELLSKKAAALDDLQEQLFLEIYSKTGIVFLKPEEGNHPFLPHTLRQLTHFLKVLSEMEEVEFDLVYGMARETGKTEGISGEIEKLKHNIDVLMGYFTDYWCRNWLDDKERSAIYGLISENRKKDAGRLYRFMKNHFDIKFEKTDNTYQKVINKIREAEDGKSEILETALELYFTFWLNGWFAEALEDEKQYRKIQKYLGTPFALAETVFQGKENPGCYPEALTFTAEVADMNKITQDWKGGKTLECIRWTCEPLDEQEEIVDDIVIRDGSGIHFDETVSKLRFNVLNPVLLSLDWQEEDGFADNGVDDEKSDNAIEVKKTKILAGRKEGNAYGIHIAAKRILANTDVQNYLAEQIWNWIRRGWRPKKGVETNFLEAYLEIYERIDSWIERATYLRGEKFAKFKTLAKALMDNYALELLYSSSEYKDKAKERYQKEINDGLINISSSLEMAKTSMEGKTFKADDRGRTLPELTLKNIGLEEGILRDLQCSIIAPENKGFLKDVLTQYSDVAQSIQNLGDSKEQEKRTDIINQIDACIAEIEIVKGNYTENGTKKKQTDTTSKQGKS